MYRKHYVDIDYQQKNHNRERICGDVFLTRFLKEENRLIIALSDGMGHGVKAHVLATLTATMAVNFTEEHKAPARTAEIIMNTLPECSERKMCYSTFTILDIDLYGEITIVEYDNPVCFATRGKEVLDLNWEKLPLEGDKNKGKIIRVCHFKPSVGTRIIFCSDGISQAGLGTDKFPFGWGEDNMQRFVSDLIARNSNVNSREIATKLINTAYRLDNFKAKDDCSCGVVSFVSPRNLLICTGPPYEKANDNMLATEVKNFQGRKIIMGATTGDIIARELNLTVQDKFDFFETELPPVAYMDGIDLLTEGVLTLNKIEELLQVYTPAYQPGQGAADQIIKMIRESDFIHFIIGTRVNVAHQDPTLPIELEIRRTIVRRVVKLIENKMLKEVKTTYI